MAGVVGLSMAPTLTLQEDALPDSVVSRVATLIQEGALPPGPVLSALRARWFLHCVLFTLRRMRTSALAWGPCVVSRHAPLLLRMWIRFARLYIHFLSTSGAGRSGLRPSHIRDAMRPASSDLLLCLITEVVNLLLQGDRSRVGTSTFVCGASIMALRKPNGTLRPIAVGETIRRITSKVAVELISDRARTFLEPLQLGVKTSNGCEAIIHTTRQWFHRHRSDPSKTAISVDISNAFNTVHRSAVLQSVRTHFPSLAPWVDCCYRHDSHLITGSSAACDQVIPSSRVVQQGDPLGPALFALAIHSIIQEARQDTERSFPSGLDICAFYLDDGICAGTAPAVSFFLSSLALGLGRIGLVVNLSKTEVIPACTTSQTFGPDSFTRMQLEWVRFFQTARGGHWAT